MKNESNYSPFNNDRHKRAYFTGQLRMKLVWSENAWEDYLYWQKHDKKLLHRINELIKAIKRDPFKGIGDPEPLKYHWQGYWSRRITREHRLVYKVTGNELWLAQCRYHY